MTYFVMLAYFFPPFGGAGVQRTVKFVKHLPAFEYHPVVVTGLGPRSDGTIPPDSTLGDELPPGLSVYRIDSEEPASRSRIERRLRSLLGLPSPFASWWVNGAVKCGLRACMSGSVKFIYATVSPYESALVASRLAAKTGVPWIADLRDPWALDDMEVFSTFIHKRRRFEQMRDWLATASTIIMNTPEAERALVKTFPTLAKKRIVTITNGYDEGDFKGTPPPRQDGKFRIVHCGLLHTEAGLQVRRKQAWRRAMGGGDRSVDVLTRSHFFLLRALELWSSRDAQALRDLEVVFVGASSQTDRDAGEESALSRCLQFTGYLPHAETLNYLRTADLVFLPLYNLPPGERARTVPGKTYEYMASGRPILAAVPDGDAKDFLDRCGTGFTCRPDDCEGMVKVLQRVYEAWCTGVQVMNGDDEFVKQFERRCLAEQLAHEFDIVLSLQGGKDLKSA
jgi:glycosyltransferase involved in cell wall biosynthesis